MLDMPAARLSLSGHVYLALIYFERQTYGVRSFIIIVVKNIKDIWGQGHMGSGLLLSYFLKILRIT